MLAFTFGLVANRFDDRKSLVREEANAIRTAWERSDFLPEPDRAETKRLFLEYVNRMLDSIQAIQAGTKSLTDMEQFVKKSKVTQEKLWNMAVANARKDMNSDVAALYIESLNEMTSVQANRVMIGLRHRVPPPIWIVLYTLTFCGMASVGYQTGIAGSRRSSARPFLALSFSVVVTLIAALDRPDSFLQVSQQPHLDLRDAMSLAVGKENAGTRESPQPSAPGKD
jgi:ribosomal protein L22